MKLYLAILVTVFTAFPSTMRSEPQFDNRAYTLAVEWSHEGKHVAAVGIEAQTNNGFILVIDSVSGQVDYELQTKFGGYASVAWSSDDQFIAVGGYDQAITIINMATKEVRAKLIGHRGVITSVDWNSRGTQLVSSSPVDQQVILWDAINNNAIRKLEIGDPWAVEFSPNDENIAIGSMAGLFVLPATLNIDSNQVLATYQYSNQYIGALAWSNDGSLIGFGTQSFYSAVNDLTPNPKLYIVSESDRELLKDFEVVGGEKIFSIAWSLTGSEIATYSTDGFVKIWDHNGGTLITTISANADYIETSLGFSPFGGRLAFGSSIEIGAEISTPLQIMPDGSQVLAGGAVQIAVPAPSTKKLQTILGLCRVEAELAEALAAQIEAGDLEGFIADVSALTDAQMPIGCKADLLAVARALVAEGS